MRGFSASIPGRVYFDQSIRGLGPLSTEKREKHYESVSRYIVYARAHR